MLDESVLRLPISDAHLSRDLGYIIHTERTLSNAAQAFMQMLVDDSIELADSPTT